MYQIPQNPNPIEICYTYISDGQQNLGRKIHVLMIQRIPFHYGYLCLQVCCMVPGCAQNHLCQPPTSVISYIHSLALAKPPSSW